MNFFHMPENGVMMLEGKRVLLIIGGGIAAYKSLELVRLLRAQNCEVRCVPTRAARHFVSNLSLASLSGAPVRTRLFDAGAEGEMDHIQLSRAADMILIAPATAHIIARLAQGLADDLATTLCLASDKPILIAPAMNVRMWAHPATGRNLSQLKEDGVLCVGPDEGDMACGETGFGRMSEPEAIVAAVQRCLATTPPDAGALTGSLTGRRALITAGPTREAIDPVRYLSNRSSGKQGYAIAAALARAGAETTLVSGPTALPPPKGVALSCVETAREMLAACEAALPVDIAVCVAAVCDWQARVCAPHKEAKDDAAPRLALEKTPDILHRLGAADKKRPHLLVGFAAETLDVVRRGAKKREAKACDWLLANDVAPGTGVFGGDENHVHFISQGGVEDWQRMTKTKIAETLAARIARHFADAPRAKSQRA